jgi:hypothetical protein
MAAEMGQKRALITQPSERVAESAIKRLIYKTVKRLINFAPLTGDGNDRIDI